MNTLVQNAFNRGYNSFGKGRFSNPYDGGDTVEEEACFYAFERGWLAAQDDEEEAVAAYEARIYRG